MEAITVKELLAAVHGELLQGEGTAQILGVNTDSRTVKSGEVFLPLVGERFDGHDYIEKAISAGAEGCLCARVPETLLPGKFYIKVSDTLLALKDLAAWYRAQFSIPFVQVTGSVGKTTTKEMIASVLGVKFHTLKTEANYNNEIGTPQTLLGLSHAHQAAVIETGMDRAGQIRYLGEMVKPDIAVITNVGDMHIEYLGSRENILKAKCEIFETSKRRPRRLKRRRRAFEHRLSTAENVALRPVRALRCPRQRGRRPWHRRHSLRRDDGKGALRALHPRAGKAHGLLRGDGRGHR